MTTQTCVVSNFVADQKGERRFGQGVERAGPGVEVELPRGVQGAEVVVEPADREVVADGETAVEVGERAVLARPRGRGPVGEAGEDGRGGAFNSGHRVGVP